MAMKEYRVFVIPKRPARNDHGAEFTIYARNRREARQRGRYQALAECFYDRLDGALIVTITEEVG